VEENVYFLYRPGIRVERLRKTMKNINQDMNIPSKSTSLPLHQLARLKSKTLYCSYKATQPHGTDSKSCKKFSLFKLPELRILIKSRDSSVGIALGYGLDDRGSRVRFPVGAAEFFSSPPRPELLWGPPSLLSNEYQGLLPWG
jgi:hypothetical protein